ncbi:22972_t:CDS:2, partial [Gigaspora margarita]
DFVDKDLDILPSKLKHDGSWKEPDEKLSEVTSGILHTLNDAWNNPAFSPEFAKFAKRSAELQSSASEDRRGEGRGRRLDIMLVVKCGEKNYELMYSECSRLSCTLQKDKDDEIKLWREANDGMYWAHNAAKPDQDEFGIVAIQK